MSQNLTWTVSIDPAIAAAAMRDLASTAKTTTADIEESVRKEANAAIALQRQRSAALIAQWKADVTEAQKAEQQKATDAEKAQAQANAAVLALQRQRSAALIAELKAEQVEADKTEKAKAVESLKNAAQIAASHIQLSHSTETSSKVVEQAIDSLGEHLNVFVGERLPLVGGGFIRLTDNLRSLHIGLQPVEGSVLNLGKAIGELSGKSGKSVDDVKSFLESYVKLGSQAEKDTAAINFFGGALAQNLSPALNRASTEMTALASAGGEAGAGIGAIAAPIAIAVAAVAALIAVEYELITKSYEASQTFAEQGAELARAADQTKLTIEQLDALKLLADENKLSFDGLTLVLGKYLRAVVEARQNPTGPIAEDFQRLGIDVEKLGDDPVKAINALFEAFNRLGPSMRENQGAQALLSREGIRYITLLRETGGSLDEVVKKYSTLRQFQSSDIENAKKQEAAAAELARAYSNVTTELGRSVSPEVIGFLHELTTAINENKEGIKALFNAASWLITGSTLKEIFANIRDGVHFVNELTEAWNSLSDKIERAGRAAAAYAVTGSESVAGATYSSTPAPAQSSTPAPAEPVAAPRAAQAPLPSTVTTAQLEGLKALSEQIASATATAIAKIDSNLKLGTVSQKTATEQIIAELQKERDAKLDYLNAEIAQHQKLLSLAPDAVSAQKEQNQLDALQQKALEARAKFENDSLNKRTELQTREREAVIAHFTALANIAIQGYQDRIAIAQRALERGEIDQKTANKRIEENEEKIFAKRRELLIAKLQLNGKESEDYKKLVDELKALDAERTSQEQQQADRRKQIVLNATRTRLEIEEAHAQSRLTVDRIAGEARTAEIQDEANRGIRTHEEAARIITGIVLTRIDAEVKAEQDRKKDIAKLYPKEDDRAKAEAAANDRLSQLSAERLAAIRTGNIAAAQARQEDIDQLRTYETAYARLVVQAFATDEEISRLRLELLRARGAPMLQILIAQLKIEEDQENRKHAAAEASIAKDRDEALKRVKGVKDEDAKKLEIQKQFDLDMEKERQRHNAAMGVIDAKGGSGDGTLNPKKAGLSLFKSSNPFVEAQKEINQHFTEGTAKAQLFVAALGAIDQGAQATAQAVGAMTQQWILYGKAGDSFQKVAAQVIASLASQAIAQAAYQFASGLAWEALFWFTGDPQYQEAANFAFLAAAAFGAVGGVAAIAGRAVAGNAFASASGGGSTGAGRSSNSSSANQASQPQTITLGSQRDLRFHMTVEHTYTNKGTIDSHIKSVVLKGMDGNGEIRQAVVKEIKRQE